MEVDNGQLEKDAAFMDKYSRQIGAFGIETMAKLIKLKVLIVGMQGVGIECAKNLVLAGPGAITLHDDGITEMKDLGANFFLSESDVGQPRAVAVAHKVAELNKMVTVKAHSGPLTEELVGQHTLVVFTHTKRNDMVRWNEFCRTRKPVAIGFIACDIRGAMGYAFTDFGDQFLCHDATGENPITRIITDISNDEHGVVTLLGPDDDGKMHEMPDSDHDGWVEISEVLGMNCLSGDTTKSINSCGPFRIEFATQEISRKAKDGSSKLVRVFDPYRLKIGDTSHFGKYNGGGMLIQHKKAYPITFRSLTDCLRHPVTPGEYGLMFTDGAKFGRAEQIHVALLGLLEFEQKHGHLPRLHHEEDATLVLEYAKAAMNGDGTEPAPFSVDELEEQLVRTVSYYAAAELHPLAAFFGGVIAQEIVKFTGKFTPLKQWIHIDAFEVLPDDVSKPTDTAALNSRYDHIISIYGKEFQETKLGNIKTFLVGCGALGCEYLKNFAMIGLACGKDGHVTVTDNDRIEVSNLNRQFLFRDHNVGQAKSTAATDAVIRMNENLNVTALEHFVAPHTEHIFHEEFWNELDIVTNALDNVTARLYVDSKCVYHKKPLLESGTLGTKCNVQVVIPDVTQSYADGPKDAETDNIPMCTLRNFPSLIEHCIEWARAQFEDQFVVPAADAKKFIQDPTQFLNEIRKLTIEHPNSQIGASAIGQELDRLRKLLSTLQNGTNVTFEVCLQQAFDLYHLYFRDRILQLIHNFPEDHVTNAGEKFWSGAKRFPQAAQFDIENEFHVTFLIATANILAVAYGLQPETELVPEASKWRDLPYIAKMVHNMDVPMWAASTEKIAQDDAELKKMEEEKKKAIESGQSEELSDFTDILSKLQNFSVDNLLFCPADFEKDQDLNFHIDFIFAASNLRASNYKIKNATRHSCKMIAGKIIPAIATTTASVTGLAMLEMLKLIQGKKLDAFKDSSNSLGLNMYLMQEPAPPEKAKDEYDVIEMADVKCLPPGFTKWDRTLIQLPGATLRSFCQAFKEATGLKCDLLFHKAAELGGDTYKPISGLMLYDRNAFNPQLKACYESKMDTSLKKWIEERYKGLVDCSRPSIELQTSCSDDQDNAYKVPRVILYY